MNNGSYRIERMEVVDNNSDHDEVMDAAITYKIDGTYPSNSSKDRKREIRKRAERLEQCNHNHSRFYAQSAHMHPLKTL